MKTWKKTHRQRRRIRWVRKWGRYYKQEERAFDRAARREQTALATMIASQPGRHAFRDRDTGDLYGGEGPFPPVYASVIDVSLNALATAALEARRPLILVGDKGPEMMIPIRR